VALLLAGCAADTAPPAGNSVVGYRFYDANHPNGVNGASAQAIENARRGTWLWPPEIVDWP
jgi:hypothetical protein